MVSGYCRIETGLCDVSMVVKCIMYGSCGSRGEGQELLSANCGKFGINHLLFADDTASTGV